MSVKKFKFVSPGVFINEIDNSALPKTSAKIGPVIIGRTRRGPGMRPVRVESFSEFIEIFGTPVPGGSQADAWRDGGFNSPMYAPYAAQAWLKNNSPVTVVRLLGEEHTEAGATQALGAAGWLMGEADGASGKTLATAGGAYGLFLINSSSNDVTPGHGAGVDSTPATGTLAAIFYTNTGTSAYLSGTFSHATETTGAMGTMMKSSGANQQFTVSIEDSSGIKKTTFNFDRTSNKYIRKVFNTNATITNSTITATTKNYFLGETFDRAVADVVTNTESGAVFGFITPLKARGTESWANRLIPSKAAQTGWFISQDLGDYTNFNASTQPKLFKLHTRKAGTYEMHNLKVAISNMKTGVNDNNPYSTFTLTLRHLADTDSKVVEVERFSNLNLNPNSPNYIARRIGDRYVAFDTNERRLKEYGKFRNQSNFVRIEMDADLDAQGPDDPSMVPFGFFGPPRPKGFSVIGNYGNFQDQGTSVASAGAIMQDVWASEQYEESFSYPNHAAGSAVLQVMPDDHATSRFTGSFNWPTIPLRVSSSSDALSSNRMAYHGFLSTRSATSTVFDASVRDVVLGIPDRDMHTQTHATYSDLTGTLEIPVVFTLDDVHSGSVTATNETRHAHASGSRDRGQSITSDTGGYTKGGATKIGWEAAVLYGADKFVAPFFGGSDGLDITEADPFRNTGLSSATEQTNYAFNSLKQAIDVVADTEFVECNILTVPGLTNTTLTQKLIDVAEDRADCLAIIDIENDFIPAAEGTSTFQNRVPKVDNAVKALKDRVMDSSYGCAYFPFVQMLDNISNQLVFVPPSVVALGVMAHSENRSKLWFAPAGFNRGGITAGAAGIPVVDVAYKLSKKERDELYDANINPIASFPAEGLVVFGQKTLQATPSALDRINVRRLLIFLKKEISRMANGILFDQNTKTTWNRFTGKVDPFLRGVKTAFGLTDYKIVLDDSTTTADLIDRNVLYAKIFLKPAKAIEFIAIDFNITNQGAAFDD